MQMKRKIDKFTKTILKLLTKQIHIIWGKKTNKVIFILNLNVINVYLIIFHERLIHDLKIKKISIKIINWIWSFLKKREIILSINNKNIDIFSMTINILQRFFISLILYLFYNVDLLKACSNFEAKTTTLSFVNDVNILAYGINTEKNCRILEKVHKLCAKWANTYETEFASFKYELIHLTRNVKKFNMKVMINIKNIVIEFKSNIRVLKLQIDFRLKWDFYVKKIQIKMSKQKLILSKLTTFIWKTTLAKIRIFYSSIIRSFITYVSAT